MKALLVDPRTRSVQEVEYDGTPAGLASLYPYTQMTCEQVNTFGDHMMYCKSAGHEHNPATDEGWWGVDCGKCDTLHRYAGRAVLFGTYNGSAGQPRDTVVSARGYQDCIQWNVGPAADGNTILVTILGEDGQDYKGRMTTEELLEYLTGSRH